MKRLGKIWFLAVLMLLAVPSSAGEYRMVDPAPDLEACLRGAAEYCRKLNGLAFHFVCREQVDNTENKLNVELNYNVWGNNLNSAYWNIERIFRKAVFDYQLIREQGRIREQRFRLEGEAVPPENELPRGLIVSYLSERAVFGPGTLMSRERQGRYVFGLKTLDAFKGRHFVVIQCIPRRQQEDFFESGTVWVDSGDFSVRRIEVVPKHIRGYGRLKTQARLYRARLMLSCEIDYDREYQGVYFPTRVVISEGFTGGPIIGQTVGLKVFERSRTVYRYRDYRFFTVSSRVRVD